jgi:hypothetical protein
MPIATNYSTSGPIPILLHLRQLQLRPALQPVLVLMVHRPLAPVAAEVAQDVEALVEAVAQQVVVAPRKVELEVQAEEPVPLVQRREPFPRPLAELHRCRLRLQIMPLEMLPPPPQQQQVAIAVEDEAVAEAAVAVVAPQLRTLLPRLRKVPSRRLFRIRNGILSRSCGPPKRQAIL